MSMRFSVSMAGKDALYATDPNDYIFHASYNTLKILATGTADFTVPHSSSLDCQIEHGQASIPLVMAFMREGIIDSVVFVNNTNGHPSATLRMDCIKVDSTYATFTIYNNAPVNDLVAHVRYYIFEVPV